MNLEELYAGKSVFVTGHTGFKGSWLTEWLLFLGAHVTGYSLPPSTKPALFTQLGLRNRVAHFEADIRQGDHLREVMLEAKPEFVFHLAAQPLVRYSYAQPRETYDVNVMGTVNTLEALRALEHPTATVFITTDKCYAEKTLAGGYREDDPLGGHDPYSSSKAAAELAIATYRRSFFSRPDSEIALASARAGNVLGGGDWAADRLVPDSIRSLVKGEPIAIRNRSATRPWQHVLDPLCGYLELGAALAHQLQVRAEKESKVAVRDDLTAAFNFGPCPGCEHSVLELVEEILKHWPGTWNDRPEPGAPHEAAQLSLVSEKAFHLLGWSPMYNFQEMVRKTVEWYRESLSFADTEPESFAELTRAQIRDYEQLRAKVPADAG